MQAAFISHATGPGIPRYEIYLPHGNNFVDTTRRVSSRVVVKGPQCGGPFTPGPMGGLKSAMPACQGQSTRCCGDGSRKGIIWFSGHLSKR